MGEAGGNGGNPGRARARDGGWGDLVPQKAGGALCPPFPAGNRLGGFRRPRRQALAMLHEGTPEASQRLLEMVRSPDERVALGAIAVVLGQTLGKPGAAPVEDGGRSIDLAALAADEIAELQVALATVRRLRGVALARAG
jgi:hypothetical protein